MGKSKASPTTSPIHYSVIVPAYKENGNIRPLVTRIFKAVDASPLSADEVEVLIIDDNSNDGSVETVKKLADQDGLNVRIIVRTKERGLSSAVVRGFQEAKGDAMLCMDADLQHPPESVPDMLQQITLRTPFVLGTRYADSVKVDEDWPVHRRFISWGARLLALPLTPASDPMSGFFGIHKDEFKKGKDLNLQGFKIALELLVKCKIPVSGIAEVPFDFGVRAEGESKLTGKVIVKYLEQLLSLYWWRFGRFIVLLICLLFVIGLLLATLSLRSDSPFAAYTKLQ